MFLSDGSGFAICGLLRTIPPLPCRKMVKTRDLSAWAVPLPSAARGPALTHTKHVYPGSSAPRASTGKFRIALFFQASCHSNVSFMPCCITWPLALSCTWAGRSPSARSCHSPAALECKRLRGHQQNPGSSTDTESAHPKPPHSAGFGDEAALLSAAEYLKAPRQ